MAKLFSVLDCPRVTYNPASGWEANANATFPAPVWVVEHGSLVSVARGAESYVAAVPTPILVGFLIPRGDAGALGVAGLRVAASSAGAVA